jgi:hypothetical protein
MRGEPLCKKWIIHFAKNELRNGLSVGAPRLVSTGRFGKMGPQKKMSPMETSSKNPYWTFTSFGTRTQLLPKVG